MNYILFDDQKVRKELLPLTFTRPVADIRFGILTMREKWEIFLGVSTSTLTESYLSKKFPLKKDQNNILINSSIFPDAELCDKIKKLESNQVLAKEDKIIAMNLSYDKVESIKTSDAIEINFEGDIVCVEYVWDLFSNLDTAINFDFTLLTKGRKSQEVSNTNKVIGEHEIFIEEGAYVEFAYLNATNGPIYIAKDAEVMEAAVIRGPFTLGEHSVVRPHAKIFGPTSIGPHSKFGGEISNCMVLGFSNKAHDGFIGNSVIGEWCNLGAGTNSSNLKNTYDSVKIWNYKEESFVNTGLQFCGLIMGDHSKCSINTMFNTGTVVGVSANLFGNGFPRQFVSSFSWGGFNGYKKYLLSKAIGVAEKVYARRNKVFDQDDKDILKYIYESTL